ncbi:MAG: class I SAM-dependent methyltransferase [Desulfobacterales bacterium]|jgi:SAM-dependent methyltransferase
MDSVRDHYESHLAPYYAWICGGAEHNLEQNRTFFKAHNVQPLDTGRAFDLGAGCGFQSIPLAEIGFRVVALDLSVRLLGELKNSAPHLPIDRICDDITHFSNYARGDIDLVVCMGDTLTHLATLEKVAALLQHVFSALVPEGRMILSFRNLSEPLVGLDRFIPVRSDENTIFSCFLEYGKNSVAVHDIVYEKKRGRWALLKSSYRKCRISPDWIRKYLQKIGFTIEYYDDRRGLIDLIARKKKRVHPKKAS